MLPVACRSLRALIFSFVLLLSLSLSSWAHLNCKTGWEGKGRRSALPIGRYQALSEEQREKLDAETYVRNLGLSRTISTGTSVKLFELSPDEVLKKAKKNAEESRQFILDEVRRIEADTSLDTEEELSRFVLELNAKLTDGMASITSGELKIRAEAGQLRHYPMPGDPPGFSNQIESHFRDLIHRFYLQLVDPATDPIRLAAQIHHEVSTTVKPFHDGGGRTSRALVDFVLMRKHYPLPTYPGPLKIHPGGMMEGAYVNAIRRGPKAFETYLRSAILESLNRISASPTN